MGTYVGHCESCDVTLEAESIILTLLNKYPKTKAIKIIKFALIDIEESYASL